jgi:hypothetical protein
MDPAETELRDLVDERGIGDIARLVAALSPDVDRHEVYVCLVATARGLHHHGARLRAGRTQGSGLESSLLSPIRSAPRWPRRSWESSQSWSL